MQIANEKEWQEGAMSPSEWARQMQEHYLNQNDEETAMVYYRLAELWISRGL